MIIFLSVQKQVFLSKGSVDHRIAHTIFAMDLLPKYEKVVFLVRRSRLMLEKFRTVELITFVVYILGYFLLLHF